MLMELDSGEALLPPLGDLLKILLILMLLMFFLCRTVILERIWQEPCIVKDIPRISFADFARVAALAARRSCEGIADPKDGTIVSVIKDWATHLSSKAHEYRDFHELLSDFLLNAQASLKATTEKLAELKSAGVVDAGALGFVYLLEGNVGIVTDSSCDIPADLRLQYDIRVAPLRLTIDGQEYIDQDDIDFAQFYEMLPKSAKAHTSQSTPGDMKKVYECACSDYENVVSLHIAKVLSRGC